LISLNNNDLANKLRGHMLDPKEIRYDLGRNSYYIPETFRAEITLHLLLNEIVYRDILPIPSVPLILGIQGPPGVGKSWQTIAVCAELDTAVYRLSGASLSGEFERESAAALLESYRYAAQRHCAILIEDIDTSAAATFGTTTTYTVNRQLLCGALMNLSDAPTHVEGVDEPVRRTPIITTGNDFRRIYQPLRRHGRMALYEYLPTAAETKQKALKLLKSHFPHMIEPDVEMLLNPTTAEMPQPSCDDLLESSDGSISFFVALCAYAYRYILWNLIADAVAHRRSLSQLLDAIQARRAEVGRSIAALGIADLQALAAHLRKKHRAMRYLDEELI
jgi:SpoVK/Ycf46/Vps4 family AAA+-type ATPase